MAQSACSLGPALPHVPRFNRPHAPPVPAIPASLSALAAHYSQLTPSLATCHLPSESVHYPSKPRNPIPQMPPARHPPPPSPPPKSRHQTPAPASPHRPGHIRPHSPRCPPVPVRSRPRPGASPPHPKTALPHPNRHSGVFSRNPVLVPETRLGPTPKHPAAPPPSRRPQPGSSLPPAPTGPRQNTLAAAKPSFRRLQPESSPRPATRLGPQSTPRSLKSFLEKTLTRATHPHVAPPPTHPSTVPNTPLVPPMTSDNQPAHPPPGRTR